MPGRHRLQGPAEAPLSRAQSAIASRAINRLWNAQMGAPDAGLKDQMLLDINADLVRQGYGPIYSRRKLADAISNRLYTYRLAQRKARLGLDKKVQPNRAFRASDYSDADAMLSDIKQGDVDAYDPPEAEAPLVARLTWLSIHHPNHPDLNPCMGQTLYQTASAQDTGSAFDWQAELGQHAAQEFDEEMDMYDKATKSPEQKRPANPSPYEGPVTFRRR